MQLSPRSRASISNEFNQPLTNAFYQNIAIAAKIPSSVTVHSIRHTSPVNSTVLPNLAFSLLGGGQKNSRLRTKSSRQPRLRHHSHQFVWSRAESYPLFRAFFALPATFLWRSLALARADFGASLFQIIRCTRLSSLTTRNRMPHTLPKGDAAHAFLRSDQNTKPTGITGAHSIMLCLLGALLLISKEVKKADVPQYLPLSRSAFAETRA